MYLCRWQIKHYFSSKIQSQLHTSPDRRTHSGVEAGYTVLLDQHLQLLLHAIVPVGDVHVQRVVATSLAVRPVPPLLEGCHHTGTRLGHHVVNCSPKEENQLVIFQVIVQ